MQYFELGGESKNLELPWARVLASGKKLTVRVLAIIGLNGAQKHAQKRSNAIQKEKLHPIIKKLEIEMRKDGDETMLRSIVTQNKNYESRMKKVPKNL